MLSLSNSSSVSSHKGFKQTGSHRFGCGTLRSYCPHLSTLYHSSAKGYHLWSKIGLVFTPVHAGACGLLYATADTTTTSSLSKQQNNRRVTYSGEFCIDAATLMQTCWINTGVEQDWCLDHHISLLTVQHICMKAYVQLLNITHILCFITASTKQRTAMQNSYFFSGRKGNTVQGALRLWICKGWTERTDFKRYFMFILNSIPKGCWK